MSKMYIVCSESLSVLFFKIDSKRQEWVPKLFYKYSWSVITYSTKIIFESQKGVKCGPTLFC